MAITGEVTVTTARSYAHVTLNGENNTVRGVLEMAGVTNPQEHTVRVDGELVTDLDREVTDGQHVSAFMTRTVASGGVKGAADSGKSI